MLLETVSGTSSDRSSSVLNHCSQPTLLTNHSTNSSIIKGLIHLCLTSSKPYTRKESTISPFLMMTNQMTKSIKTKLKQSCFLPPFDIIEKNTQVRIGISKRDKQCKYNHFIALPKRDTSRTANQRKRNTELEKRRNSS